MLGLRKQAEPNAGTLATRGYPHNYVVICGIPRSCSEGFAKGLVKEFCNEENSPERVSEVEEFQI